MGPRPPWRMGWSMSAAATAVCAERQHRRHAVELCRRRTLARSGEWGGLCRLRRPQRQRVCAERQHRRQAVELCNGKSCAILARHCGWGGVPQCGRRYWTIESLRLQFGRLGSADLFLRIRPTTTTVHQGDLLTYAFPVWNLGPDNADHEVLNTQVPEGTTFDYVRISGTPGLGTCTTPPYEGTGEIVCHENSAMAPNTTWTVRVVVKVTAPAGTVITESATTTEETPDPNLANNTATVSITVQ